MLTLKTKAARVARPCIIALVPLALSACEIEVQTPSDSYDDGDFGGATLDFPGGSTRREVPSTNPDRTQPSSTAASSEEYWDGPGMSTYVELVVLDPGLVHGPHAGNAGRDAPWSFRAQMAWLAGGDTAALAFSVRWLDSWQTARAVGSAKAPVSARPALRNVLMRPWLGGTEPDDVSDFYDTADPDVAPDPGVAPDPYVAPAPGAAPDAGVSPEPSSTPAPDVVPDPYAALPVSAWARAPFRLIAIVNRVDLAGDACGTDAGELRYVYTATEAGSERALDLSVIIEIPYPRSRSAAGWARAWLDVATAPAGSTRDAALLALTREVALEADPLRARVRTNEAALAEGAPWQMREFQLYSSSSGALDLRQEPLALTPRADADLGQLADHLLSHADQVLAGGAELPEALRAGAAEMPAASFSWRVPGISERLRSAFSGSTCNGCHAGDTATERFQHIAPRASATAPARLSRFLYDESAPTDELRRREALLLELAATTCPGEAPPSGRYY